jgi:hypothetical protein
LLALKDKTPGTRTHVSFHLALEYKISYPSTSKRKKLKILSHLMVNLVGFGGIELWN